MKISIIGYSGAGKSTLAKKLRDIYHIDVLHLDRVNYISGWQTRDLDEAKAMVDAFLSRDNWIIEGNYQKLKQDKRFALSDFIIFLDFPVYICLPRAYRRYLSYRGRSRDDGGENCEEKFDFSFFWWIVFDGRRPKYRKRYKEIIEKYPQKVIILKRPHEVDNFLTNLNKQKLPNP